MTADMPRVLDRKEAVPALVGDPADFLLISGLAGTGKDIGALTGEDHIQFLMTGAMGAAAMTGFGLALAQPRPGPGPDHKNNFSDDLTTLKNMSGSSGIQF